MPTISCVIPTHKRADMLAAAIASALEQTLRPDEIVVVSDVEDADARAVCDAASTDAVPVVYVERPEHAPGASSSRNAGAAAARGELLAFLDDDDVWRADYLATVARFFQDDAPDAVITWMTMFSETMESAGASIDEGLPASHVLARNPGMTGSNLVVTASAFTAIGGFDEGLPVKNDTDLLYRFLRAGLRYRVNRDRQVRQRRHSSGQLTAHSHRRADGVELYIAKHRADLTREQLRHLRFSMARMRANAATGRLQRLRYRLRALSLYSVDQFRRDRGSRRQTEFFRVADFAETPVPR